MGPSSADRTYGYFASEGENLMFGSSNSGLWYNYKYGLDYDISRSYDGVYLVSEDASVSIDEADLSAAMRSVSDVSVPAIGGILMLAGLAGARRSKCK
jgi:hypothetical protein